MTKPINVRLDRLLANLGYGSRRDVQAMVAEGLVIVDGHIAQHADNHIQVTQDIPNRIMVDGASLDPPPPLNLILHKPLGYVCSHKEPGRGIYDLLPVRWRRRDPALSTVGRLDKETSGLLLLTDDGGLLHRIISPKAHIAKRYHVTLEQPFRGDEGVLFASGAMMIEGETKPLLPAKLEIISSRICRLTITEGRYRQVRRMFAATGNTVVGLHRDRIGGLDLPADLFAGDYRPLTDKELIAVLCDG